MSNLEKLPTELLVDIFLYCMNIGLPRSSPVIGGKLTNELVYTRTIVAAFGPTWEAGYGKTWPDDYGLSGFLRELDTLKRGEGDGALQVSCYRYENLLEVQTAKNILVCYYKVSMGQFGRSPEESRNLGGQTLYRQALHASTYVSTLGRPTVDPANLET